MQNTFRPQEKVKGNHSYMLPVVREIASSYNPDIPLLFTEGEKKAAKATLEGFPTIGLSGVWNFKDAENDFLPELDGCVWTDRRVYITYDSDITEKHNVKRAELRLAIKLINRGAKVFSIRLPNEPNGEKNGLDDYLVKHGTEAFQERIKDAKPTLETHVEEGTDATLLLKELPRLTNEIYKVQILKTLAKREGVKMEVVKTEYQKNVPKVEDINQTPHKTFTAEQLRQAEDLLNSPDIFSSVLAITKQLGFTGEEINQKLLYLSFTSRLMDDSISVIVKGQSASGKSHLTNTVLRLFPQSEVLSFSFVTSKALVHRQDNLSHKILFIQEHTGSEGADYSVRTMLSEGEISIMLPVRNEATGKLETVENRISAKGLVFVETTTRDRIHHENQTRVFDLYVDESERQTANILMMQAAQLETDSEEVIEGIRVWRAAQSLLKVHRVYVPYAQDLAKAFPTYKTRARRDFQRLLSLIRAHALLNQYQRKTIQDGRLIATLEDLSEVLSIIERVLEDTQRELTPKQTKTLNIIFSNKISDEFSTGDFLDLVESDRKTIRKHLKHFEKEGFIEWNGESGRKSRYTKVSNTPYPMSPIGSFISKIQDLLEKRPGNLGNPQKSPNIPNTPISADKGHRDNKGQSPMPPMKTNDKEEIREINGIGDIGTEERGDNIPSKGHKEAEVSNSEDWEAVKQRFLGEKKKDVEL